MGLFGRRRTPDRLGADELNKQPDLTGYDEKMIFGTDADERLRSGSGDFERTEYSGYRAAEVGVKTEPRPMVFASRKHSDIFIYEYPDRLEYYVKTATTMYKFDTVLKKQ